MERNPTFPQGLSRSLITLQGHDEPLVPPTARRQGRRTQQRGPAPTSPPWPRRGRTRDTAPAASRRRAPRNPAMNLDVVIRTRAAWDLSGAPGRAGRPMLDDARTVVSRIVEPTTRNRPRAAGSAGAVRASSHGRTENGSPLGSPPDSRPPDRAPATLVSQPLWRVPNREASTWPPISQVRLRQGLSRAGRRRGNRVPGRWLSRCGPALHPSPALRRDRAILLRDVAARPRCELSRKKRAS